MEGWTTYFVQPGACGLSTDGLVAAMATEPAGVAEPLGQSFFEQWCLN